MSTIEKHINEYLENKPLAFHSPAHAGTLHEKDLTELSGLDDLQYPSGIIQESQDFVADLFGAEKSFFLVNGASVGIMAAMLSLKGFSENQQTNKILVPRNVHKSVISGLILSGLEPVWYEPKWLEEWSVYSSDLDELSLNLDESKDVNLSNNKNKFCGLVLTNPTYEGFYTDLNVLKNSLGKLFDADMDIPIIVDEAHGAHYHFSSELPKPALDCDVGVDVVIQSWHKCLGSYTQTGVLHLAKNSKINAETIAANLRLLQTTSPSYLFLENLSLTAHKLAESGEEFFANAIALAKKINLTDQFQKASNHDPLRALLKLKIGGAEMAGEVPGEILDEIFEENGVALESHSFNSVLAFINYAHGDQDISAFSKVLGKISRDFSSMDEIMKHARKKLNLDTSKLEKESCSRLRPKFDQQVFSPREAFYSKSKRISLTEAEGEISAELYAPCPPGIALLVPGQNITRENLDIIRCADKTHVGVLDR